MTAPAGLSQGGPGQAQEICRHCENYYAFAQRVCLTSSQAIKVYWNHNVIHVTIAFPASCRRVSPRAHCACGQGGLKFSLGAMVCACVCVSRCACVCARAPRVSVCVCRVENWTNPVQNCPTPDKSSTILGFWDLSIELTYRTDGRLEHI